MKMARMKSLILVVILSFFTIGISTQQPDVLQVDEDAPECEIKGPMLFCDYGYSQKNVRMSAVGKDVQKVFIYNVKDLRLSDYGCVNLTIHNAEDIYLFGENNINCTDSIELSVKNSALDTIPNQVTNLYLEGAVLSSLVTSMKMTKLVVINSKIGVLELRSPVAARTSVSLQNTKIESLQQLSLQEGSSLIIQKSKIVYLRESALSISDASIVLKDSSVETSWEDSVIIHSDSRMTLENFTGNLKIKSSAGYSGSYSPNFYTQFITCLGILMVTCVAFLAVLVLYIVSRVRQKQLYREIQTEEGNTSNSIAKTRVVPGCYTDSKDNNRTVQSQDLPHRNANEESFQTLNNLEEMNVTLTKSTDIILEQLQKEIAEVIKSTEKSITKIENVLKYDLKNITQEKNKNISDLEKDSKYKVNSEFNGIMNDILQRTKEEKKKEIEISFKSKIKDRMDAATNEITELRKTIMEKNKNVISTLLDEGKKTLTCLTTTRVTCKGSVGEVTHYENIFKIFEGEIQQQLTTKRDSFGRIEPELKDQTRGVCMSLETLQTTNCTFQDAIENLIEEEQKEVEDVKKQKEKAEDQKENKENTTKDTNTEMDKPSTDISKSEISDREVQALKTLHALKRKVLREHFLFELSKCMRELSETYHSSEDVNEIIGSQKKEIENVKRLNSIVLDFHRHYIQGAKQMSLKSREKQ